MEGNLILQLYTLTTFDEAKLLPGQPRTSAYAVQTFTYNETIVSNTGNHGICIGLGRTSDLHHY
jgi:hypothetical protein